MSHSALERLLGWSQPTKTSTTHMNRMIYRPPWWKPYTIVSQIARLAFLSLPQVRRLSLPIHGFSSLSPNFPARHCESSTCSIYIWWGLVAHCDLIILYWAINCWRPLLHSKAWKTVYLTPSRENLSVSYAAPWSGFETFRDDLWKTHRAKILVLSLHLIGNASTDELSKILKSRRGFKNTRSVKGAKLWSKKKLSESPN